MSEVHRYKVVKMLSEGGNRISYDPHGPEVVMASAYDQLKAENEALRKDAERYQWVSSGMQEAETLVSIVSCHGGYAEKIGERVDVYVEASKECGIDAAMSKEVEP
ncbi:hypothetical protein [Pseudomonas sp. SMN5]|uniref:hypothetical protein n=1 Tax=Pseudomonas sp. SMN5 TaxID=3390198 RepID=UPI003F831B91